MSDEAYSFSTARVRLEEIVSQVRKKDTSLEKSLDLLEEGVRLANACTELIDHADWTAENPPESVVEAAPVADASVLEASAVEEAVSDEETENSPMAAHEAEAPDDAADAEADDDFGDADEAWTDEEPVGT